MPSERVFSLALTCEPAIVQPFPAVFGGNSGQSGKRAAFARPAGRPPAAALRRSGTGRRGPDSAPGVENPDGKRQKGTPAPATEASPGRRLRGVAGGSPVLVWKALCIAALGGVLFRKSRIGVGALPPATASRTACEESRTHVEGAVWRERYSRRTREVPYPRTMYRRATDICGGIAHPRWGQASDHAPSACAWRQESRIRVRGPVPRASPAVGPRGTPYPRGRRLSPRGYPPLPHAAASPGWLTIRPLGPYDLVRGGGGGTVFRPAAPRARQGKKSRNRRMDGVAPCAGRP